MLGFLKKKPAALPDPLREAFGLAVAAHNLEGLAAVFRSLGAEQKNEWAGPDKSVPDNPGKPHAGNMDHPLAVALASGDAAVFAATLKIFNQPNLYLWDRQEYYTSSSFGRTLLYEAMERAHYGIALHLLRHPDIDIRQGRKYVSGDDRTEHTTRTPLKLVDDGYLLQREGVEEVKAAVYRRESERLLTDARRIEGKLTGLVP